MSLACLRRDVECQFLWQLFCTHGADANNVELKYMKRVKNTTYPIFIHMTNRAFYYKYRKVSAKIRTELMRRAYHNTPPQERDCILDQLLFTPRTPTTHPNGNGGTTLMDGGGSMTLTTTPTQPQLGTAFEIFDRTINSTDSIHVSPPTPPPKFTRQPYSKKMTVPRQVSPETIPNNGVVASSSSPMMPLVPYEPYKDPNTGRMTIVLVFLLFSGTQSEDVQCSIINGGTTFQIQWCWPSFLLHPKRLVNESTDRVDPIQVMAHLNAVQQNLKCLPQQPEDPPSPSIGGTEYTNGSTATSTGPKYYCTMDYSLPIQVEEELPRESMEFLAYPIKNGGYPNQHGCYLKVRLSGVNDTGVVRHRIAD